MADEASITVKHEAYESTASSLQTISDDYSSAADTLVDDVTSLVTAEFDGTAASALLDTVQGEKIYQYMSWLAWSLYHDGDNLYDADNYFQETDQTQAQNNASIGGKE